MNNIAIICVNYNNNHFTEELIDSVRNSKCNVDNIQFTIVVVDNSEGMESVSFLAKESSVFCDVKVLKPKSNLGYFHGLNFGLSAIDLSSYRFVIIANNDIKFKANFFESLVIATYPSDAMLICPDVITKDGFHQNPHRLNPYTRLNLLLLDLYFSNFYIARLLTKVNALKKALFKYHSRPAPINFIELYSGIGACYVLTPLFLASNNQLYFPGFLYGEEACLAYQVQQSDGRTYLDPKLVVYHEDSATLSKLPKRTTYNFGRDSYWKFRHVIF